MSDEQHSSFPTPIHHPSSIPAKSKATSQPHPSLVHPSSTLNPAARLLSSLSVLLWIFVTRYTLCNCFFLHVDSSTSYSSFFRKNHPYQLRQVPHRHQQQCPLPAFVRAFERRRGRAGGRAGPGGLWEVLLAEGLPGRAAPDALDATAAACGAVVVSWGKPSWGKRTIFLELSEVMGLRFSFFFENIQQIIVTSRCDRTLESWWMYRGIIPKWANFQVSEILSFTQKNWGTHSFCFPERMA